MENTLKLLLQDTTLKWYTVINDRPAGPLSAKEIVERLKGGDLNFASHVWKEGFKGWTRLYDVIDFKPLLPSEPSAAALAEIQNNTQSQSAPPPMAHQPKEELRVWFLYLDESSYGPVSEREVNSLIESGRVIGTTFMWTKGFTDWQPCKDIEAWSKRLGTKLPAKTAEKPADKRAAPRKPFETKILLTDGKEVGWALCRDISVGGMQVLMDHAPGPAGTSLRLNVNPQSNVPGFACEGVVVRVLEDGRGFSFRFHNLSPEARAAIDKYIGQ